MGATFYNGGPRALVWGCFLVVIGSMAQALSMAELGAILPIGKFAEFLPSHFFEHALILCQLALNITGQTCLHRILHEKSSLGFKDG